MIFFINQNISTILIPISCTFIECVFPFVYSGVMYNTCTRKDSQNGQPWCATNVDEATKEVLLGNWGDCDRSCVASGRWPEENITISTSLTNIPKLTPSDVLYSESRYFKE